MDLKTILLELFKGHIVWSRDRHTHRVRYGKQIQDCPDDIKASEELGHCIRHYLECEGSLDKVNDPIGCFICNLDGTPRETDG